MKVQCNNCRSYFDEKYIKEIESEEVCPCCGRAEYMVDAEETMNYLHFEHAVLNRISVADLVAFDDGTDECFDYVMHEIRKDIETDKECPRCGSKLYCSDLPEYDYVCVECEENFYECEVK